MVVISNKSCCRTLYYCKVMNVVGSVWIPNDDGTIHLWSHRSLVAEFLGLAWVLVYISVNKSPGVVGFPYYLVYVGTSFQFVVDVSSQIFCGFDFL